MKITKEDTHLIGKKVKMSTWSHDSSPITVVYFGKTLFCGETCMGYIYTYYYDLNDWQLVEDEPKEGLICIKQNVYCSLHNPKPKKPVCNCGTCPNHPIPAIETDLAKSKPKTKRVAPALVKLGKRWFIDGTLFSSLEAAKAYLYSDGLIWPARDGNGNEIWYEVPDEE